MSSDWLPLARKRKKSSVLEVIIFRGAHVACTPVDHSCAPLIIVDRTLSFVEQCDYLHMFETLDIFYVIQSSQVDMTENKEKRNKSNSCL